MFYKSKIYYVGQLNHSYVYKFHNISIELNIHHHPLQIFITKYFPNIHHDASNFNRYWKLLNCDNFFCVHHSMNSPNTLQILIIVGSTNSSLNTTTTFPIITNMTCLCNIALNYMCPFAKVWFVFK